MRETAVCVVPTKSASCCWVRPLEIRAERKSVRIGAEYAPREYSLQAYSYLGMDACSAETENQGMTTIKAALGRAIADIRGEREMNQEQLAERAGIGQPKLSKIERGKQDITADALGGVADALGVKASEIWARAESAASKPAHGKRLTKEGSEEMASAALTKYREPNNINALRWTLGALVGYIVASAPEEAGELVKALEGIPKPYQKTGPGAALLTQLDEIRAADAARQEAELRTAKPRRK